MSNLFSSLRSSADALRVFDRALSVVQNNVANVGTAGFARQSLSLQAKAFLPEGGLSGGVAAGALHPSRDTNVERFVRGRVSSQSEADQRAQLWNSMETRFPVRPDAGIPAAMDGLWNAFSQLSISPNSKGARQQVLDRAGQLALQFRQSAEGLQQETGMTDSRLREAVGEVNRLAGRVHELNVARRQVGFGGYDAGVDAQLHQTLEELSQWGDVSALEQSDGTMSVTFGGQVQLVMGERTYPLSLSTSNTAADILDAQGQTVTGGIQSGKLASLLSYRNQGIPGVQTDLHLLAKTVADQVNAQLAAGLDANGQVPNSPFLQYTAGQEAATLALTSNFTPEQIAAAAAGAPSGNGNAQALAGLGQANSLGGTTLTGFYGQITSGVGAQSANAKADLELQSHLEAQARGIRQEISGVDLNEEATHLIEFQRSFQAAAKLVTALDELTQTVIGLIR